MFYKVSPVRQAHMFAANMIQESLATWLFYGQKNTVAL